MRKRHIQHEIEVISKLTSSLDRHQFEKLRTARSQKKLQRPSTASNSRRHPRPRSRTQDCQSGRKRSLPTLRFSSLCEFVSRANRGSPKWSTINSPEIPAPAAHKTTPPAGIHFTWFRHAFDSLKLKLDVTSVSPYPVRFLLI